MTMIIPAWGLIMHLVKKILYSIIRSITNRAFSILIHSSMSVADVKVMVKGIWALFLIALLGCIVFGIDFSNCIFINEI